MRGPTLLATGLCGALLCAAPGCAFALDTASPRSLELERALSDVRRQVHVAPHRAGDRLEGARRRLHELQIEAPRDPRLWHLEREIDRLRAEADRVQRRQAVEADLRRLEQARGRLPTPDYLRAPHAGDLRGTDLPVGTGKSFLFLGSSLRR